MRIVDFRNDIRSYIACEIETLNKLDIDAINDALNLILETHENHKRVFVFGNGGSSATASHFYNDFVKGLSEDIANKFRFHCLNDNIPTVMAIANDIGFEEIFRYQLRGVIEPGDIVALSIATRAYVLETGRITKEGSADALMHDDDVRRAYLG